LYTRYHFSGTDFNAANDRKAIYKILGDNKGWSSSVDSEQGNADYMMFADLDYSHPEVQADVKVLCDFQDLHKHHANPCRTGASGSPENSASRVSD
jgi:hypothetical protein